MRVCQCHAWTADGKEKQRIDYILTSRNKPGDLSGPIVWLQVIQPKQCVNAKDMKECVEPPPPPSTSPSPTSPLRPPSTTPAPTETFHLPNQIQVCVLQEGPTLPA